MLHRGHHVLGVAKEPLKFQGVYANPKIAGCIVKPVFIMVFHKTAFFVGVFIKARILWGALFGPLKN